MRALLKRSCYIEIGIYASTACTCTSCECITFLTAQSVPTLGTLAEVDVADVSPVVHALKWAGHVLRKHEGLQARLAAAAPLLHVPVLNSTRAVSVASYCPLAGELSSPQRRPSKKKGGNYDLQNVHFNFV